MPAVPELDLQLVYFPRLLYVAAKFSMVLIASGYFTPRILFLAFRTLISSFSDSVHLPRLLYVTARFAMALIVYMQGGTRI